MKNGREGESRGWRRMGREKFRNGYFHFILPFVIGVALVKSSFSPSNLSAFHEWNARVRSQTD